MTLSNLKSMLTKSTFTKSLLAAAGAAALLVSAPAKSDAQVVIAARFGRPAVVERTYAAPRAYAIDRREELRRDEIRREEIRRHEEWLRAHRYDRHHDGYYR